MNTKKYIIELTDNEEDILKLLLNNRLFSAPLMSIIEKWYEANEYQDGLDSYSDEELRNELNLRKERELERLREQFTSNHNMLEKLTERQTEINSRINELTDGTKED